MRTAKPFARGQLVSLTALSRCSSSRRTARGEASSTVEVIHPFHPLRGQRLVFLYRGTSEEEEWVFLQRHDGAFLRIPVEWTNLRACDPYQDLAQGRSLFRLPDLFGLTTLA
ncbi:MAG: DUF5372 family protein, partial [Pirellulaceae bacterium]